MNRVRLLAVIGVLAVAATACSAESGSGTTAGAAAAPPLDPAAESGAFEVPRIASTPAEDFPSALRGSLVHESFPPALIDIGRILPGGPPPDGIPPIDEPLFENAASVDWLAPNEPVLAVVVEGEARAYPIQIMTWHELVNDAIAGVPVTISYCPLCNSALAYDRRLGDRILDFGTSGALYNSSLVMYDRQTETLWTHFDGRAVVGALTGEQLTTIPISTVSWDDFRTAHPEGLVLSRDTGFRRDYGRNPYVGYDDADSLPFLFDGSVDPRLSAKTRVVVVRDDDEPAVLVTLDDLLAQGVIEFEAHGRSLIAAVDPGTASPLDDSRIDGGYDQGASAVFVDDLDGRDVSLVQVDGGFLDENSGVVFNVFGEATDGSDRRLELVEHLDTFWFAIAAFEPDVEIVGS